MNPATFIGRMRDVGRIEKVVQVRDTRGQTNPTWTTYADHVPMEVISASDREYWITAQPIAGSSDVIRLRYDETLEEYGAKWRVVLYTRNNRIVNISSVRWADDRGVFLYLDCAGEGQTLEAV